MLLLSMPSLKSGVRVRVEHATLQKRVAKFGSDCVKRSVGSALLELMVKQGLLREKQLFYLAMLLLGLVLCRLAGVTLQQMRKEIGPNLGLDLISYALIAVTTSLLLGHAVPSTPEVVGYGIAILFGLILASLEVLVIEQLEQGMEEAAVQRELEEALPETEALPPDEALGSLTFTDWLEEDGGSIDEGERPISGDEFIEEGEPED